MSVYDDYVKRKLGVAFTDETERIEYLKARCEKIGLSWGELERIQDPNVKYRTSTRGRLLVFKNGNVFPVLDLLAISKFGLEKALSGVPVWIDRNWRNEVESNVEIREGSKRPVRSKYGVRAGSPGYMKAWREANPDKVSAAQRRWRMKTKVHSDEVMNRAEYGQFSQYPSEQELAEGKALKEYDAANAQASFERALEAMRKSGKTDASVTLTLGDIAKGSSNE